MELEVEVEEEEWGAIGPKSHHNWGVCVGLPGVLLVLCPSSACTVQLPFLMSTEEPLLLSRLHRTVFSSLHLSAFSSLYFLSLVFPLFLIPIYQT